MLEWRLGSVQLRISLLFLALLTALLFLQPEGVAVSCVLASVMHECGHLLVMLLLRCPPERCTLGAFGMRMEIGHRHLPGYRKNLLISLAGPAVNAAAAGLLWAVSCRRAAVVHLVLCVFNLLPAQPLDGGEILYCLFCLHFSPQQASRFVRGISFAVLLPLALLAAIAAVSRHGNGTLLVVGVYLFYLLLARQ